MALDASFVLIEGDWPCARAHRLVEGLRARWVVVHRLHQGEDLYYAFKREHVLGALPANGTDPVGVVLNLHETDAARTRAADTDAGDHLAVVVSRGLVAGVSPAKVDRVRGGLESFEIGAEQLKTELVPRAVEAIAPPQVARGDTVPLVVKLTSDVAKPGTVPLVSAVGDSIEVVVNASGGLEIQGRSDGEMKVTAAGTPALLFKIAGRAVGPGEVTVYVFQRGQCVGSIPVSIRVVNEVSDGNPATATARVQPVAAQPPDLQLLVLEGRTGDDVSYTMRLSAADPHLGLNLAPFGPFGLEQDPRSFFDAFYADVEAILTSAASPQQKLQRLASKGDYLFDTLVPSAVRGLLWTLRPRIHSVHIQSEEPWIPWELIKLSGDDGTGMIVEGGFLCEEFEVTRWVPGLGYKPDLTLNDIGVVTPSDSGLSAAVPERDALLAMAAPQRRVTPIDAEEVALRKSLAAGTFDAIHFTGHGLAPATSADRAEIRLEQGSRLRPEDLTGLVRNLGRKHPLVFLNACEIGRAGMGLTGPGGWPRGFLAAGAGAFVGPFWKVLDASAASFADSFYQALIGGASVGKAALEARKQIQAASDPTWLAYSVYAHSDARVT